MLGINDQRASTLASLLRWQRVSIDEVVVGDVLVSDGAPIEVAEVLREGTTIWIRDIDENGFGFFPGRLVSIIARDCLDPDRTPAVERIAQQREVDAEFRSMYPETT